MNTNRRLSDNLRLLLWNINGIQNKTQELSQYLTDYNIHIALISETHLKANKDLKFPNYSTYRKYRDTIGGGVAIIIQKSLPHYQLPNTTNDTRLEQTGVKILLPNNKNINIHSIYSPPSAKLDENELEVIFNTNCPVIAAGDYNSKNITWNCNTTNENGRRLEQYATNRKLEIIAPKEPTHYPSNGMSNPDILDIALIKNITQQLQMHAEKNLTSDHTPVFLNISLKTELDINTIKFTNWIKFKTDYQMEIPGIIKPYQLENAIAKFENHILTNFNNNTTEIIINPIKKTPPDIRKLIKEKRTACKIY